VAAKAEIEPLLSNEALDIRTLTPKDIDVLRLGWRTRLHPDEIHRILEVFPGRSVWAPETLEFAIASPWRHRHEIVNIQELTAVRHPEQLIAAVVDRSRAEGAALVLSIELDETRRVAFYDRIDFSVIEEVITYELDAPIRVENQAGALRFSRVDPSNPEMLAQLCALDHSAFPWLWWNSSLEFEVYGMTPGVELHIGFAGTEPVSYVGITVYPGWGHLDRIAVVPGAQGSGLGLESLDFAVNSLTRRGAKRVGLSTQKQNVRSQQLYERYGFRRSRANDYRLYGKYLIEPEKLQDRERLHRYETATERRNATQ
jgi:ribosomal protein S18 acetylase RimI-like enzyme